MSNADAGLWLSRRSVRESLADAERATSGEEEDGGVEADAEPSVQRHAAVPRPHPAGARHQPRDPRHGLRPHRPQRRDRADRTGTEEWTEREETLERDVGQTQAAGDGVACSQTI